MILPRFPHPLDKGDKLRAYHQLKYLSQNHEVFVFALSDENVNEKSFEEVNKYCSDIELFNLSKLGIILRLIWNIFGKLPFQTAYHNHGGADKKIQSIIQKFQPDFVYFQLLRTAEFAKNFPRNKALLDFMDTMSKNVELRIDRENWFWKIIFKWEYKRLLNYESHLCELFEKITVITERDKSFLPLKYQSKVHVISNGIDSEYFFPQDIPKKYDIAFVGAMSYAPNIEASIFLVKKVLPILLSDFPNIKIVLAGANPDAKVRELASENVIVTGTVEDIRSYYASSKIFVAPLFISTGLQNKILEAMSMKIPVVTSVQANEALGGKPDIDLLTAETEQEFAVKIKRLLNNDSELTELTENGFRFVQEKFGWERSCEKLEELIK